jgi:cytochrome c oxidase subunit II
LGLVGALALASVQACATEQSALHPAGRDAEHVAVLFWVMAAGGAAIWFLVIATAIYAVLGKHKPTSARFAETFIFVGGVVFPTIVLAALLIFGLRLLPNWTGDDAPDVRIHVEAHQFWWRMTYDLPQGGKLETANEVHLPVGGEVEFIVTSPDVIHAFWIPALGGKIDAIPGRSNVIRLKPTRTGRYRGVCAEYCGLSHARMAFDVHVHEPAAYADWLSRQQVPAQVSATPFLRAGCAACHTVRGVIEQARTAPDLTHLASRHSLAAGTLPMDAASMRAWLVNTDHIKPDAGMPAYDVLPEAEVDALVSALMALD